MDLYCQGVVALHYSFMDTTLFAERYTYILDLRLGKFSNLSFQTCGAPFARLMTQIRNQVFKVTPRANNK